MSDMTPATLVLVTGATGFVGRKLVTELRACNYQVAEHSSRNGDIARDELSCPGVQHVFHLAGKLFVPESWIAPWRFYEVNVLGTVNVLELCRREGASLTLLSSYVYGQPRNLPISEDHPVGALNPYGHTKLLAEQTCSFYAAHYGVRATILRLFNVYGPGQPEQFLIPTLLKQALDVNCKAIEVKDARPKRDYLHISDLVSLILATLEKPGGTYNAGSGHSVSIQQLVQIINGLLGIHKPMIATGQPRLSEVLEVVADISKAARELDWYPKMSLEAGLLESISDLSGQKCLSTADGTSWTRSSNRGRMDGKCRV